MLNLTKGKDGRGDATLAARPRGNTWTTWANGPFRQVLGGLRSVSCGQPSGKAITAISRTAMPATERPADNIPGRISCGSADWHCIATTQSGLQAGVGGQSLGQQGAAITIGGAAISAVRAAADARLA